MMELKAAGRMDIMFYGATIVFDWTWPFILDENLRGILRVDKTTGCLMGLWLLGYISQQSPTPFAQLCKSVYNCFHEFCYDVRFMKSQNIVKIHENYLLTYIALLEIL